MQAHAVAVRRTLGESTVLNRRFRGCSQITVAETLSQLPFEVVVICRLHELMPKVPRAAMAALMKAKACVRSFGYGVNWGGTAFRKYPWGLDLLR